MLSRPTIEFRKRRCAEAGCDYDGDFAEPCSQCPNGHWGPMMCNGFYLPPKKENGEMPSVEEMAKSIAKSATQWIKGGVKITSESTFKTRLETCHGCEFWNPKGFGGTGRCMKCGCSTWAKLRMATEKCPVGKW